MTKEALELRKQYQREYYASHREIFKEAQKRYWEKKALKENEAAAKDVINKQIRTNDHDQD